MTAKRKKKPRMGRPLRHSEPLSETVLLRLTPTQFKAIQRRAAADDITVPELIRMVLHAELMPDQEWEG